MRKWRSPVVHASTEGGKGGCGGARKVGMRGGKLRRLENREPAGVGGESEGHASAPRGLGSVEVLVKRKVGRDAHGRG